MEHGSLLLAIAMPVLLLVVCAPIVWWSSRSRSGEELNTPEGTQLQQQFRQWRNRRAEEEMVQMLKELGWPKVVKQMTPEEVSRQLCNRLAVRLWNRPNVD